MATVNVETTGVDGKVTTKAVTVDDGVANADTVRQAAQQALAANRAFVALATPNAAQTTAQVKALSRQQNGLIRLLLGQLDATD